VTEANASTFPSVEVVQTLPGRVHLRVRSLRRHRDVCQRVANQLATDRDYDRVSIRPLTGSVIIEREAPLDSAGVVEHVSTVLSGEAAELTRQTDANSPPATRLAVALATAVRGLNIDLNQALEGEADLATLGPFALVTLAVVEVSRTGNLPAPPWSSLVWYALRSFISFNASAISKAKAAGASGVAPAHPHDLVGGGKHEERPTP
jgi:hypothetical protein